MDQSLLVRNGHRLIEALDKTRFPLRFALWFHDVEYDAWRLWLVPLQPAPDKREFYRVVSMILAEAGSAIDLSPSAVRLKSADHPAIHALLGMSHVLSVHDGGEISVSHNMLDGFYMQEGIILRMLGNEPETTAA